MTPAKEEKKRTAPASNCRPISWLEAVGRRCGRAFPGLPMRGWIRAAYHRLFAWRHRKLGLVCTLPGGEQVRILPEYPHLAWNLEEYAAFKTVLGPGGIALDVGANLGCYTLLFAQWVGPAGQVFAFEPAPATFAGLRRHVALNHADGVVRTVQAAISATSGTAPFFANGTQGENRIVTPGETRPVAGLLTLASMTLDEFCARERVQPDLIKIDVEGFELAVLQGARETIRAGRGSLALFVEMHPTTWREIGVSREDLLAELDHQGLRAQPITASADPWAVEGVCMRLVPK